jgi:predicted nicotinamide N-methyase
MAATTAIAVNTVDDPFIFSEEIRELLKELEYEQERVNIPGGGDFTVRSVDEIPIELLMRFQEAAVEISGRRIWPGSVLLALAMANSTSTLNFKLSRVCELGAGSGLSSMVAARLGAEKVVITDGDITSVDLAKENFTDNGFLKEEVDDSAIESTNSSSNSDRSELIFEKLLWGKCKLLDEFKEKHNVDHKKGFDIVIAGDVMYKSHLPLLLFETMKELLDENGVAMVCHLVRAGVTQNLVCEAAVQCGLVIEKLPLPMDLLPNEHCSIEEAEGACLYVLRHQKIE